MNTKELLTEAKNLINLNGWIQGDYGDAGQGFCTVGAISEAASDAGYEGYFEAMRQVRVTLKARGNVTAIGAWNDASHRTKEDVLNLLDEAAANA